MARITSITRNGAALARRVGRCQPAFSLILGQPMIGSSVIQRATRSFSACSPRLERVQSKPVPTALGTRHGAANIDLTSDASQKALSEMAFAFDIDGVLYQGKKGIPGAKETLRNLRNRGVRYVFLTNGGCAPEIAKAESLSKRIGLGLEEDVVRDRIILSHTPMSGWDDAAKKQTVLITGSHPEVARRVAKEYGFANVVTPADLIAADEDLFPFDNLRDSLHSQSEELPEGKKLRRLADPYSRDLPADLLKIDQILIWNDPRDWALDIQIIHDLLISHKGYLGTVSTKNGDKSLPNSGWQQDGQPSVWISNVDLVWKTEYPVNRFGTGAFLDSLKGVWSAVTGGAELKYTPLGKPWHLTYKYAHDRLLHYNSDLEVARGNKGAARTKKPLRRVYMIGDNPESDIRGANEFKPDDGTEWISILVRTGVWQQTALEQHPRYKPAAIVDDVVDAIVWAMRNEGLDADRDWVTADSK